MEILHKQLERAVLDKRVDEDSGRLVVVLDEVAVGEVLEELHDVDGDVDVVVAEEVDDRRHGVERDEVGVELRRASEDAELEELVVELELGVGELRGVFGVLEARGDVVLEAALEGEDELL